MNTKRLLIISSSVLIILIPIIIFFNKKDNMVYKDEIKDNDIIEQKHSDLYIPDISVEDIIKYFNEVSLDAEKVNSGNPNKVQKWADTIYFYIEGNYTQEDLEVINKFTKHLNTIEGFPGIYETRDKTNANLQINFTSKDGLLNLMGEDFVGLDGAVTFWYNNDIIYNAQIAYRTDIDQKTRNSVILEEIYNGLGPIQDTDLREDSIIYSGFSTPQELTEIDKLILKLLYHPKIKNGMTKDECEEVIRKLYY